MKKGSSFFSKCGGHVPDYRASHSIRQHSSLSRMRERHVSRKYCVDVCTWCHRWLKLCTHTHTHTHIHNTHWNFLPISYQKNMSYIFEQLMNFEFQSCKLMNRKYSCYTECATGWTVQGSNFGKCKKLYILQNVQTGSGAHLDLL
jgi:hypothetical protein